MLTINVETGNAAFSDGSWGLEIARILRHAAYQTEKEHEEPAPGEIVILRDSNGNRVGSVCVRP